MKNLLCINLQGNTEIYEVTIKNQEQFNTILEELERKYSTEHASVFPTSVFYGKPVIEDDFKDVYDGKTINTQIIKRKYSTQDLIDGETIVVSVVNRYYPTLHKIIRKTFIPFEREGLKINLINLTDLAKYAAMIKGESTCFTYDKTVELSPKGSSSNIYFRIDDYENSIRDKKEQINSSNLKTLQTEEITSEELREILKVLFQSLEFTKIAELNTIIDEEFVTILASFGKRNMDAALNLEWLIAHLIFADKKEIDLTSKEMYLDLLNLSDFYDIDGNRERYEVLETVKNYQHTLNLKDKRKNGQQ